MLRSKQILIAGDVLAVAVVTIVGFATHGETGLSFLPRMLAAFIPLSIAWFLLAPRFGLFQDEVVLDPKLWWRPVLAMIFAAPLAAVLRGFILNVPVIPIFAVVLGATSAFGMLVWRILYLILKTPSRPQLG